MLVIIILLVIIVVAIILCIIKRYEKFSYDLNQQYCSVAEEPASYQPMMGSIYEGNFRGYPYYKAY